QKRGKKTVLGGMSPVDPLWLELMFERGVMQYIDAVGIHGLPDVFDTLWSNWNDNIDPIREVLENNNSKAELWITEAGFSTWQYDDRRQVEEYLNLTILNISRVYWYSLRYLDPAMPTVDGFHL